MDTNDDISDTLKSKSNQWCADDLTSGPLTITVTGTDKDLSNERPVAIFFDVDGGRPWRPCLTMRRLISHFWSPNRQSYVGRSLTIYRDATAVFGGLQVGGIRVSHIDGIEKPETVVLQENNKKKKTYTIQPLKKTVKPLETPRQDAKPADPYAAYGREFARRLKEEPWQAVDSWFSNTESDREGMAPERIQNMKNALAEKIEEGGE